MDIRKSILAIVLTIGLSAAATRAFATTTGAIEGFATDSEQRPLAGVHVSAVSPSGHGATTTGPEGYYSLNGLPLDTYSIVFTKAGYLPTSVAGVTTTADQTARINVRLAFGIKTLARVAVRGSTSLVQPTDTSNTYVISQSRLSDINGTPQDENGFGVLGTLPGFAVDNFGSPTLRGGASNEIGFTYDDVNNVEPATSGAINALSLNGTRSINLSTGGFDVSSGEANTGVVNQVIKRGTYPAEGETTIRVMSPLYGHELSFDFGGATPDNRYSYYVAFGGLHDGIGYGDNSTPYPLLMGFVTFNTGYDDVINIFYHFGHGGSDELQFLSDMSGGTSDSNYLEDPSLAPYPSNNGDVQAASDPFGLCDASKAQPYPPCNTAILQSSYTTFVPGQAAVLQNVDAPDSFTFNSVIEKLNFKRQLTPSSYAEARLFRTTENFVDFQPHNTGSFSEFFGAVNTTGLGEAIDYAGQLSSEHELGFGGDGTYYPTSASGAEAPSLEPAYEPLEDLGCPQIAAAILDGMLTPTGGFHSTPGIGGCYIAPFNAALDAASPGLGLPTDAAHAPMQKYASDSLAYNDSTYRYDAWIKDRYQPNQRLTITYGLRWDKESIPIPADAAALDTTYFINASGDVVTVPGSPIGSDVTQPSQISPRVAAAYELGPRDAIRFSYGKNIEFASLYASIRPFSVPPSLRRCTIADGCFIPLPGFGVTNHVTNLYDQVLLDLTTNMEAQYGHVLPQRASNVDFSWSHSVGGGLEFRVTPYYRKGTQYAITNQPLLFTLPTSGTPVFGAAQQESVGINESTGVEFAMQRNAAKGVGGSFDVTFDNTLANYDGDFVPGANNAAVAAGHFFHITYIPSVVATLNLTYSPRPAWHALATVEYESGYRYGVGKKAFVFVNGVAMEVPNSDLAQSASQAYYFTSPANPGTIEHPNIIASRGTPEGDDPGTLLTPAAALVNFTISHDLGPAGHGPEVGVRVENAFGDYASTFAQPNPYYVPLGNGGSGSGSGRNPNRCAPGQTFGCEPLMFDLSRNPYELEPGGPPRVYTFFISAKI